MTEEKIKVIIEDIEDEKVAVYQYDELNGKEIGSPFEVCSKIVAIEQYKVVGELLLGSLELWEDRDKVEEDFSEFSIVDEDEP